MTDREKIFDLMTNGHNPAWAFFPNNREFSRFVDYLLSHGVTVQRWIPVTEQLPKPDMEVLAFNGDYIFISMYYEYKILPQCEGFMTWRREQFAKLPTHWMPLPESPNEVQK